MYADVKIPSETRIHAQTLPIQAVQPKGAGEGTVLVVSGANRIEQRNVKLGIPTPADYEVLSGVQENEMVVFGEPGQYRRECSYHQSSLGPLPNPPEQNRSFHADIFD